MIGSLQQSQMVRTHGDPFARKVQSGTSDAAGKMDTLLVSSHGDDNAPSAAMMVRTNWNTTNAPSHFGTAHTYGVHAESLDKFPSLRCVVRATGRHASDMVVSDANHHVSAVIPLGLDGGSTLFDRPIHSVTYQREIEGTEGYLTLNGEDTYRVANGKMDLLPPHSVSWWARDYRAYLRQDG